VCVTGSLLRSLRAATVRRGWQGDGHGYYLRQAWIRVPIAPEPHAKDERGVVLQSPDARQQYADRRLSFLRQHPSAPNG